MYIYLQMLLNDEEQTSKCHNIWKVDICTDDDIIQYAIEDSHICYVFLNITEIIYLHQSI